MGTCDDEQAACVRVRWAERMWREVQKEVMRPKQALDIGVALAVKRLWSVEGKGAASPLHSLPPTLQLRRLPLRRRRCNCAGCRCCKSAAVTATDAGVAALLPSTQVQLR